MPEIFTFRWILFTQPSCCQHFVYSCAFATVVRYAPFWTGVCSVTTLRVRQVPSLPVTLRVVELFSRVLAWFTPTTRYRFLTYVTSVANDVRYAEHSLSLFLLVILSLFYFFLFSGHDYSTLYDCSVFHCLFSYSNLPSIVPLTYSFLIFMFIDLASSIDILFCSMIPFYYSLLLRRETFSYVV